MKLKTILIFLTVLLLIGCRGEAIDPVEQFNRNFVCRWRVSNSSETSTFVALYTYVNCTEVELLCCSYEDMSNSRTCAMELMGIKETGETYFVADFSWLPNEPLYLQARMMKDGITKHYITSTIVGPYTAGIISPNSVFSVSENKRVYFSEGNLEYNKGTNTWSFAIAQYYSGDLFGWGTGDNPALVSENDNDYPQFNDWGNNPINNGGNKPSLWRTLTYEEWEYLFKKRKGSDAKKGIATVRNTMGLILLPDDWKQPATVTFRAGFADGDTEIDYQAINKYSKDQWNIMESAGAVFLPAAGFRCGTTKTNVGYDGEYWSSTPADDNVNAYAIGFSTLYEYGEIPHSRSIGCSVRLVQDVK